MNPELSSADPIERRKPWETETMDLDVEKKQEEDVALWESRGEMLRLRDEIDVPEYADPEGRFKYHDYRDDPDAHGVSFPLSV